MPSYTFARGCVFKSAQRLVSTVMIDPLEARNLVFECISAFQLNHQEPPVRVRVGRDIYAALIDGHRKVGGVPLSFDTRLDAIEAAADAAPGLAIITH